MSNIIRNDILTPVSSKRATKEKLFKICGLSAIIFTLSMLIILFTTIFSKGYSAFYQTRIKLDINFNEIFLNIENVSNQSVKFFNLEFNHFFITIFWG